MSTADELAKLDALRQSGVLTQEEFDAEKAELLVASHVANVTNVVQPGEVSTPSEDSRPHMHSGESSSSTRQVEPALPLPPADQTPRPEGSPSDVAKPRNHRSQVLILVAGGAALIVIAVVILIVTLAGSGKSSTAGSLGTHDTAAESNLQTALTGADTFYSANATYNGIMGGTTYTPITAISTGLVFVGASTASTASDMISVRESGDEVVEMTAYSAFSGACLGVLDITSALNAPFFASYPQTAAVKTYYFSSPQSRAGDCKATMMSAQHLSSNGWSGPVVSYVQAGYASQKDEDSMIADLKVTQ
jgi:hypothetical protein